VTPLEKPSPRGDTGNEPVFLGLSVPFQSTGNLDQSMMGGANTTAEISATDTRHLNDKPIP
jgi:hypothetical protein